MLVIHETCTVARRALGTGPTSPDHLLELGELRQRFDGFDVWFDEETRGPEASHAASRSGQRDVRST